MDKQIVLSTNWGYQKKIIKVALSEWSIEQLSAPFVEHPVHCLLAARGEQK